MSKNLLLPLFVMAFAITCKPVAKAHDNIYTVKIDSVIWLGGDRAKIHYSLDCPLDSVLEMGICRTNQDTTNDNKDICWPVRIARTGDTILSGINRSTWTAFHAYIKTPRYSYQSAAAIDTPSVKESVRYPFPEVAGVLSVKKVLRIDTSNFLLLIWAGSEKNMWARLVKVNQEGHLLWQNDYGKTDGTAEPYDLVAVKGGFLIASQHHLEFGSRVQVSKVDSFGNVKWRKTFGLRQNNDFINLITLPDQTFSLSIRTDDHFNGKKRKNCAMVHYAFDGNGKVTAVVQKKVGHWFAAGPSINAASNISYKGFAFADLHDRRLHGHIRISRFENKQLKWQKVYGDTSQDIPSQIKSLPGNRLSVLGHVTTNDMTSHYAWLFQVDAHTGVKQWDCFFGYNDGSNNGWICPEGLDTNDAGDHFVTGYYTLGQFAQPFVVKVDKQGNWRWQFKFPWLNEKRGTAYATLPGPGNSLYVFGTWIQVNEDEIGTLFMSKLQE